MGYKDPARQRAYQLKRYHDRRQRFFADKRCVQCQSVDSLELDHIDPTTKVSHKVWSWSEVRFQTEVAKCQVLCHACHLSKTIAQTPITNGYVSYRHGTASMYDSGCHCGLCRLRHKYRVAAWRSSVSLQGSYP